MTVPGETPRTSAVSSMERPPKKRSSTRRLLRGSTAASASSASSRATTSRARSSETTSASSSETRRAPPPRFWKRRARVVDEDASHQLRGDAVEVRAVLPADVLLVYQPEVGFVNQRGGLQCVAGALPADVLAGQPAQLPVDQRHQRVERRPVAVAPGHEQLRHLLWGGCHPSHPVRGSTAGAPDKPARSQFCATLLSPLASSSAVLRICPLRLMMPARSRLAFEDCSRSTTSGR